MISAIKYIKMGFIAIMVASMLGMLLLIIVSLIPQDAMEKNAGTSSVLLEKEGAYPSVWSGMRGCKLDNFTDTLMLSTSYYTSDDIISEALMGTRIDIKGLDPFEAYHRSFSDPDSVRTRTYGRYWHGYQVLLKPLLAVTDISGIRALNTYLQLALMAVLISLSVHKTGNIVLILPVYLFWMSLSPVAVMMSLQFSAVFYITLITCIVLLMRFGTLDFYKTCRLFVICGITIAYFDLLTYPAVSLGITLILYLTLDYKRMVPVKERVLEILGFSGMWLFGYAGMWISKWIISTLITKENIIKDALAAVRFRMSHFNNQKEFTFLGTVKDNTVMLLGQRPLIVLLVIGLFICLFLMKLRKRINRNRPADICIAVICLYPFIWYLLLMNHSNIHSWMTYRELCVTLYGLFSLLSVPAFHDKFLLISDDGG